MPRYSSPLREAQAAQTRTRILDAAIAVFGQWGFTGASLAKIAAEAGVSVETVKLAGTKGALLLAAFDRAFSGRELDGPVHSSDIGRELLEAEESRLLAGLISFVSGANERVAGLWPRLREAAASDPDVAERLAHLQESRAEDMAAAIGHLRARGLCPNPRPDAELAAALSYLLAPEGYVRLVQECGWTDDEYRTWLERAIERIVLTA